MAIWHSSGQWNIKMSRWKISGQLLAFLRVTLLLPPHCFRFLSAWNSNGSFPVSSILDHSTDDWEDEIANLKVLRHCWICGATMGEQMWTDLNFNSPDYFWIPCDKKSGYFLSLRFAFPYMQSKTIPNWHILVCRSLGNVTISVSAWLRKGKFCPEFIRPNQILFLLSPIQVLPVT